MKNFYTIEIWEKHRCIDRQLFTNKRKAQKWLKNSFWWLVYDAGDCMIYIKKNEEEIDWIREDKGWK